MKREREIKKLSHQQKNDLVNSQQKHNKPFVRKKIVLGLKQIENLIYIISYEHLVIMPYKKPSWQEKLEDSKDFPKVEANSLVA